MAKLADITSEVRIIIKLLAASFIVITALFLFLKGGTVAKNLFFPTPPPPPDQKFGLLPKVEFPEQETVNLDYNVNTLTGTLTEFDDRMKVYKTKLKEPNLIALQTARDTLKALDFTNNETKISGSLYQWNNSSGDRIMYDILTNDFTILTNFLAEPAPPTINQELATKEEVYGKTMSFLEDINADTADIDEKATILTYLKIAGAQVVPADSQNDAQLARIDLFQNNLDEKYKIYYSEPDKSSIFFMYTAGDYTPRIVEASFLHITPDTESVSTYPTKTTKEAFTDLKAGKAMIFNKGRSSTIDITDVTQGYFIGSENQPYLLPIYIFTGKDFTAYVQAVLPSSIEN